MFSAVLNVRLMCGFDIMLPVVELATLEIQSSAYRALLELEALGCDLTRHPSGRIVASFLNKGLCRLTNWEGDSLAGVRRGRCGFRRFSAR